MSWNNVLPWWVYQLQYERHLAKCSCCFNDEWFSGTHKEMPDYVQSVSKRYQDESVDKPEKFYRSLL